MVKDAIKRSASNYVKNKLKKIIWSLLKPILTAIAGPACIALLVSLTIGGISTFFIGMNPDDINQNELSKKAAEIKNDPSMKGISTQSLVDPDLLVEYLKIEDSSYPKEKISRKITTKADNSKNVVNYTLDLSQVASPYRLSWQLLAAIDGLDTPYLDNQDSSGNTMASKQKLAYAKKFLMPKYTWADDKYFQTVKEYRRSKVVTVYADSTPSTSTETPEEFVQMVQIPLPVFEKVVTPFAEYISTFQENVLVNDTGWQETVTVNENYDTTVTWINVGIGKWEKKEDKKLVSTVYTYSYKREVTYEDVVQYTQKENMLPFIEFMGANDIQPQDIYPMYGMISAMPNNADALNHLAIALSEFGFNTDGQYVDEIRYDLKTNWVPDTSKLEWPAPTSTRITSFFGMRLHPVYKTNKMHRGVDIAANLNDPIVAADDGTVSYSGYFGDGGNTVIIKHENGMETRYSHLSKAKVKVGDTVTKGTVIGLAGSTGAATGVHLHYEIRIDGIATEPISYYLQQ